MEQFIVSEITKHGYLAIFLLMTVESACIPIPSEAIMLFGGALSAGVVIAGSSVHLNLFVVALVGTLGNLVGAIIAYVIGRTGGRTAVEKWGQYIWLRKKDLSRADTFFAKRGDIAVLVGRILPVIRTFISLPAGIAEMNSFKFILYTVLGSIPWTFALAYIGKTVAGNWQSISQYSTPVSVVFAIIIIGIIAWWYLKRRHNIASSE